MKASSLLSGLIMLCFMMAWSTGSRAGGFQLTVTRSGWLHVKWGDQTAGSAPQLTIRYFLVDDYGNSTELKFDDKSLVPSEGPLVFDRKRVQISGEHTSALEGGIKVRSMTLEKPSVSEVGTPGRNAVIGNTKWVTILCRFADSPSTTPNPVSFFQGLMSNTTPGMDHYWRETSFGNINLTGSMVVGWYNLPRERSYYVYGNPLRVDFFRIETDAETVADADVYFPDFYGINFIFNQELDGSSWGGVTFVWKDGLNGQMFGATDMSPLGYANQSRVAHEMGHGFGLHHSSGPYSTPYDSQWDTMSSLGICSPRDAIYGCVGANTISYHKDLLGWIPSSRKYFAAAGSTATINIERLGQPSSSNYLMAQIPIDGLGTKFYTVEARRFAGYDGQIPGEAIVIHQVDTTRVDRTAQVVDADNNGNPNDSGAMWLPGESFTDVAHGIQVSINSMNATSFSVTIGNPCAYSIAPTGRSFSASAGTDTLNVTTNAGCSWTAGSNVGWITITSGSSGNGDGPVSYSVATNTTSASRSGTLSVAGRSFTVTQAAPLPPATLTLLIDETSGRAAALDSVIRLSQPFPITTVYNLSSDQRTRVMLFSGNLAAGDNLAVVTAQAEDAQHRVYPLVVEFVGRVPNFDWLTQLNVVLPDDLTNAGDVQVSISSRGEVSNKVVLNIR